MNLKEKTNNMLNFYGIRAKKKFGQNFLVDENIIDKTIEMSDIHSDDVIIEIGPGLGNLTEKLLDKSELVIAFEIDEDMINILEDRFKNRNNFILINKDILKVNINDILKQNNISLDSVKLIANLPYYITTPIMFKIFEESCYIKSMTIMVQKEVADRIISKPKSKDYGMLTINTEYYGEAIKLFDVPNTSFLPSPKVTSSIIKICLVKRYDAKNEEIFFKLIKASFAQRRKKLINSIENSNVLSIKKEDLKKILDKNNIPDTARAEELTIKQYINIANEIAGI